jgi:hypothetical protein
VHLQVAGLWVDEESLEHLGSLSAFTDFGIDHHVLPVEGADDALASGWVATVFGKIIVQPFLFVATIVYATKVVNNNSFRSSVCKYHLSCLD